ncbi:hypothetical protein ABEF95_011112 [Exophiala dermatitidis]
MEPENGAQAPEKSSFRANSISNDVSGAGSGSRTLPLRPKENGVNSESAATVEDGRGGQDQTQATAPTESEPAGSQNAEENEHEDAQDQDYGEISELPPTQPKKKKKRSKRKPASQRGLDKPTGFEDFFADAPITPDQHAEEQKLYSTDLPFVDRIVTAIARFERTRKMTNERRDILYKYLSYGNVDVSPNSFQGGQVTEDMDKNQVAAALTQASVSNDKRDLGTETSLYAVNFLGCLQGFLSRRAKYLYGFESHDQVLLLTTTLERFMDYLLQHDVCPEYRDDVLAARNLCREVPAELWAVAEATRRLPGDFNIACSTLFGGRFAQSYDGETWWGPEEMQQEDHVFVGMKPAEASQIVHFGVAGAASEPVYAAYLAGINGPASAQNLKVEWVKENVGFEITKIEPPTEECKQLYLEGSRHFRPVGLVYAKPWKNPDSLPEDLTPAEQKQKQEQAGRLQQDTDTDTDEVYVFFIESILQSHLRVGFKVEATVRKLHCGIMFFDDVLDVYPTFDVFLHNEMMSGWKKPRPMMGAFDYVETEGDDGGEDGKDREAEGDE